MPPAQLTGICTSYWWHRKVVRHKVIRSACRIMHLLYGINYVAAPVVQIMYSKTAQLNAFPGPTKHPSERSTNETMDEVLLQCGFTVHCMKTRIKLRLYRKAISSNLNSMYISCLQQRLPPCGAADLALLLCGGHRQLCQAQLFRAPPAFLRARRIVSRLREFQW